MTSKIDGARLDNIIKKTMDAINESKKKLYEISESTTKECRNLESELESVSIQANKLIEEVEMLESQAEESKKELMHVNKNYDKYSQEDFQIVYKKTNDIMIELATKREREATSIKRRNELEIKIKNSYVIMKKTENLISNLGVALSLMSGELMEVSLQLEDAQKKEMVGLRIIKAQEDERKRVARDIHDGPAQLMSNIVLKAEICERLFESEPDRTKEELNNLKKVVRDCLQDTRKIIYNLRPMALDDLGLLPTVERLLVTVKDEHNIFYTFKTTGYCGDIRPEISLTVFRIIQEAVNNIIKHAEAENIAVNFGFTQGSLNIHIYDDGKGFSVSEIKNRKKDISSGFGLFGMKERVELLNGEFSVFSEPGKGTRLRIKIPLFQKEGENDAKD